jgi:hypothetical protein
MPTPVSVPQPDTIALSSFTITLGGDYVYPRFSPDARHLGFAEVVRLDSSESARLLVLDLTTSSIDTLMGSDSTRALGVYSAFVFDITWHGADSLTYSLSDGDVGSTRLLYSLSKHRLLDKQSSEGVDDIDSLPDSLQAVAARLVQLYPHYPPPAIAGSLFNRPVFLGDSAVLVQFSYHNVDNSVHLLSRREPADTILLELPFGREGIGAFGGGFNLKGALVFAARVDSTALVYVRTPSHTPTPLLTARAHMQQPTLTLRFSDGHTGVALLQTGQTYERTQNVAVLVDSTGLRVLKVPGELFDVDVSPDASRIAVAYWAGPRRNLGVARFHLPAR